jgi:hypothetical protein
MMVAKQVPVCREKTEVRYHQLEAVLGLTWRLGVPWNASLQSAHCCPRVGYEDQHRAMRPAERELSRRLESYKKTSQTHLQLSRRLMKQTQ